MPTTKTVTLYTYNELSPAAKMRAREWYCATEAELFGSHPEPWQDDAEQIAAILGIEFAQIDVQTIGGKTRQEPRIYWSLHTQGSGACFEGTYSYAPGAAKRIREHAPQDSKLHAIADALQAAQRRHFYSVTARIYQQDHHYTHEHTMTADASDRHGELSEEQERPFIEAFREFARWIHQQVESEYEHRTSEESAEEMLSDSDYLFNADGTPD